MLLLYYHKKNILLNFNEIREVHSGKMNSIIISLAINYHSKTL